MSTKIELFLESEDDQFTTAEGVQLFFEQMLGRWARSRHSGPLRDAQMLAEAGGPSVYESTSYTDANGNRPKQFLLRVTFGSQEPHEAADTAEAMDKAKQEQLDAEAEQEEEFYRGDS